MDIYFILEKFSVRRQYYKINVSSFSEMLLDSRVSYLGIQNIWKQYYDSWLLTTSVFFYGFSMF